MVKASAAAKSATPPHPLQLGGGIIYIRISVASGHDNQRLLGDKNVINHNKGQEELGWEDNRRENILKSRAVGTDATE